MALSIIHGKPGEGKSYHAVCNYILPALAKGAFVGTNVELKLDGIAELFQKRYGLVFNPDRVRYLLREEIPRFFEHIPGGTVDCPVLLVIDECHKYFNARDFSKNDSRFRETFDKACEHRHHHIDIVMMSQSVKNIDAQLVRLHTGITTMRNLKVWHFPRMPWLKIPYYDFLAVRRDQDGKTIMRRDWMKFDRIVGACYNTHSVDAGEGLKAGSVQRVSLNVDPVFGARVAKAKQIAKLLSLFMLLGVAFFVGTKFARKAAAAVVVSPPSKPGSSVFALPVQKSADLPAPPVLVPVPVPYFLQPPATEVVVVNSAILLDGHWSITVNLDGAPQALRAGQWCTRGRVGAISQLVPGRLWSVQLHTDDRKTITFRVAMGRPPVPDPNETQPQLAKTEWTTSPPVSP